MAIRLLVILSLVLCCSLGHAEEIPLSEIWGINIRGTTDAGQLFPTKQMFELVKDKTDDQVSRALRKWIGTLPNEAIFMNLSKREEIPPGFVVGGSGLPALVTAKMVLCDDLKPKVSFSPKHELTLVFFTRGLQVFDLKSVRIMDHRIEVEYEAPEQKFQTSVSPRFALIPLGKMPVGDYEVVIPKHPRVCRSFQFQIRRE